MKIQVSSWIRRKNLVTVVVLIDGSDLVELHFPATMTDAQIDAAIPTLRRNVDNDVKAAQAITAPAPEVAPKRTEMQENDAHKSKHQKRLDALDAAGVEVADRKDYNKVRNAYISAQKKGVVNGVL